MFPFLSSHFSSHSCSQCPSRTCAVAHLLSCTLRYPLLAIAVLFTWTVTPTSSAICIQGGPKAAVVGWGHTWGDKAGTGGNRLGAHAVSRVQTVRMSLGGPWPTTHAPSGSSFLLGTAQVSAVDSGGV